MLTSDSIKRLFNLGIMDLFRIPSIPKLMRRKGKNKLTLKQEFTWKYRFRPNEWKELYKRII